MNVDLIALVHEMNPWLRAGGAPVDRPEHFINRQQSEFAMMPDWDKYCLLLLGPRQAGKTTFGKYLATSLIGQKRFASFLYINCDFAPVREWLKSPLFVKQAIEEFALSAPIIFIDEVQRLENPGLLIKGIVDLRYPIKLIVSGSSQIEIKSRVQEYLTGRNIEVMILPFSAAEYKKFSSSLTVYGCYPEVMLSIQKDFILKKLYEDYINKDIIEILKVGKPDVMQRLITLLAHSSGQLVNYNQLATDCRVSAHTIQHYCSILEKTYMLYRLSPYRGNKRKEIVSNPTYYFVDNGFRNQALRNLSLDDNRSDIGLLVESFVFQEILKFKEQNFLDYDIKFWRTQSGAEIDFIIHKNEKSILPIEVKYRNMKVPLITKAMHSFIEAYEIKTAIVVTKDYVSRETIKDCNIIFLPLKDVGKLGSTIAKSLELRTF